jgi:CheY-like chemotaxis protein
VAKVRVILQAGRSAKHLCQDTNGWENTKILTLEALAYLVLLGSSMRTTAKILIVDGNEKFRESLREFFTGLGHEVFEAATGPEGLDKAFSIQPDLIMMDIRLPGLNGDEVTVQLKRNMSTRNIPVVLNSGWTTDCNVEERANRALNAGAAEILYKPFQLPMLRDVLRSHLLSA